MCSQLVISKQLGNRELKENLNLQMYFWKHDKYMMYTILETCIPVYFAFCHWINYKKTTGKLHPQSKTFVRGKVYFMQTFMRKDRQ